MKAAILYQAGETPHYAEVPEPVPANDDETLITVRAAAIKHLDKSRAGGKHYSATGQPREARVIGGDGVGILPDGRRVFALGVSGMIAEKAVIDITRIVRVPDGLDDATAAALPNAVAGSAMALRFRAGLKAGETVLINGATGFTGKIAVQVAKHYGAKRIIVTGRNEATLLQLKALGADETISLREDDAAITTQLKAIHGSMQVDVIMDYLWGHSAELILSSLQGNGSFTPKVRYVSIGAVTGDKISLSAEMLRSVDLQLSGSGLGSWTKTEVKELFSGIIPEMFELAAEGKLKADIEAVRLADIGQLWEMDVAGGRRLVVV